MRLQNLLVTLFLSVFVFSLEVVFVTAWRVQQHTALNLLLLLLLLDPFWFASPWLSDGAPRGCMHTRALWSESSTINDESRVNRTTGLFSLASCQKAHTLHGSGIYAAPLIPPGTTPGLIGSPMAVPLAQKQCPVSLFDRTQIEKELDRLAQKWMLGPDSKPSEAGLYQDPQSGWLMDTP